MSGPARHIEVTIDELVLHGFDPRHRERIADAVRSELAAALEGWSPAAGNSADRVDAGSFTVPAGALPVVVGRSAARQVGQILQRGTAGGASGAEPWQAGTPGRDGS
jgi:hypothetical protein